MEMHERKEGINNILENLVTEPKKKKKSFLRHMQIGRVKYQVHSYGNGIGKRI